MVDLTGPNNNNGTFADFGDLHLSSPYVWIHQNEESGGSSAYSTSNWGQDDLTGYGSVQFLTGDFTGDGYGDLATVNLSNGSLSVYAHSQSGSFNTFNNSTWITASTRGGADWEVLIADFDNDGYADIFEHQLSSGLLFVKTYNPALPSYQYVNGGHAVARTIVGSNWRMAVADFDGDGRADYADHYRPTGGFYIHKNHNGIYNSVGNWGVADGQGGASWQILFGDFTGDGVADFADWLIDGGGLDGHFWIHEGLGAGSFESAVWGEGQSYGGGSSWTILGQTR